MADKVDYIELHNKAQSDIEKVISELNTIANALYISGNTNLEEQIVEIINVLCEVGNMEETAHCAMFNHMIHSSEEATGNMMNAILASVLSMPKEEK
jgi:L-rhamnose mutarotase